MTYEQLREVCMFAPYNREPTPEELATKCVVRCVGVGYAHTKYEVLSKPSNLNLSLRDIALFCDDGNLCYGFREQGGCICVHTD